MKQPKAKDVLIMLLLFILAMAMLWWQGSQVGSDLEIVESFGITYYKPKGGEKREVQEVKLNCFLGASKGAPEGNVWCQEEVMEEWTE